jgi:hypothetical protein
MENTSPQPPVSNEKEIKKTTSSTSNLPLIILVIIVGLIGIGLIIYFFILPYFKKEPITLPTPSSTPEVSITASTTPYTPLPPQTSSSSVIHEPPTYATLEQEFPELINGKTGLFSTQAKELLKKNGFVAVPADNQEFFNIYHTNTDQHLPNFITTDSILHTANLIFTHLNHKLGEQKRSTATLLNSTLEQLKLQKITPEYVPAIFGSTVAQKIITDTGTPLSISSSSTETNPRIIGPITMAPENYDTHPLLSLITTKPGNLPSFMTNDAWSYKNLNTFLGSWTEIISTSTTSNSVAFVEGIGGPDDEIQTVDDRGYAEPEPFVYQRIAELTKQTREQLEKNKKLSNSDHALLISLEKTCATLQTISQSEINKIPLTEDAHHFIKNYGDWLQNVWEEVYSSDLAKNGDTNAVLAKHPASTLATAANFPDGRILQTGTGKVFDLFVIVTVNGKQKLARGGIYSYYEFIKPTAERLSLPVWRELISNSLNSLPPELPNWTKNYLDTSALEITK